VKLPKATRVSWHLAQFWGTQKSLTALEVKIIVSVARLKLLLVCQRAKSEDPNLPTFLFPGREQD
jgi:hypothetical protein